MLWFLECWMAWGATIARWSGIPFNFEQGASTHYIGMRHVTLTIHRPEVEFEHFSDCAVYNGPAMEPGVCDCDRVVKFNQRIFFAQAAKKQED